MSVGRILTYSVTLVKIFQPVVIGMTVISIEIFRAPGRKFVIGGRTYDKDCFSLVFVPFCSKLGKSG